MRVSPPKTLTSLYYEKSFHLTTAVSSHALYVVLTRKGRPNNMISRILLSAEESYPKYKRELLAIVWALQNLETTYLCVEHNISISDKNPKAKLRRMN